jgi:hypothetical protein
MAEDEKQETPQQSNLIEEAKAVADRIEKANAEAKALLDKKEKLMASDIISGRADAGQVPQKPKEETPQEYAARVERGEF